jgi:hypothetical protein
VQSERRRMRNQRRDVESLELDSKKRNIKNNIGTLERCVCSKVEQNTLYVKFFFLQFSLTRFMEDELERKTEKRNEKNGEKEQKFSGT